MLGLETVYYTKLKNKKARDKIRALILEINKQKHELLNDFKQTAIESSEALLLEIPELIRAEDLQKILANEKIDKVNKTLYQEWNNSIKEVEIGKPLPHFTFRDKHGNSINTNELKGKYFWITSWASKCASCIKKLKQMKAIYKAHAEKGFEIIALSWDYSNTGYLKSSEEAINNWEKALKKQGFPWINSFDKRDKIMYGLFGQTG